MVEPVPSNAEEDEPQRARRDDLTDHSGARSAQSGIPRSDSESRSPGAGPSRDEASASEDAESGESRTGRRADRKHQKPRSFWKELPILIVIALVLAFLIQQFVARVYMIPSGSMEHTLHGCAGCTPDRILVDKITYNFTDPSPGDVVVFRGPEAWVENDAPVDSSGNAVARFFQSVGSVFGLAPPDERDFVKRIIATGGQTVQCCDARNRVVVDGEPLDEPYIYWEGEPVQREFGPVTVPPGTVWVMGDNRNNSSDSRYQGGGGVRGVVPVDNIIGKARFIVLPPSRWGVVSDHNPQEAQTTAMGAPAWQHGLPLGVGALGAWPTLLLGRRVGAALRGTVRQRGL